MGKCERFDPETRYFVIKPSGSQRRDDKQTTWSLWTLDNHIIGSANSILFGYAYHAVLSIVHFKSEESSILTRTWATIWAQVRIDVLRWGRRMQILLLWIGESCASIFGQQQEIDSGYRNMKQEKLS